MRYYKIPWEWEPMPPELKRQEKALARVLLSWEGTPYLSGSAAKGAGVDCVRFVCAVFKELEGAPFDTNSLKLLPPDAAMHNRQGSMMVMRYLLNFLSPVAEIQPPKLQPGDILVVGPANGGPGHAIIVSPWRNVLFHAGTQQVCRTGMGLAGHYQTIFHVYRKGNRECWR